MQCIRLVTNLNAEPLAILKTTAKELKILIRTSYSEASRLAAAGGLAALAALLNSASVYTRQYKNIRKFCRARRHFRQFTDEI